MVSKQRRLLTTTVVDYPFCSRATNYQISLRYHQKATEPKYVNEIDSKIRQHLLLPVRKLIELRPPSHRIQSKASCSAGVLHLHKRSLRLLLLTPCKKYQTTTGIDRGTFTFYSKTCNINKEGLNIV